MMQRKPRKATGVIDVERERDEEEDQRCIDGMADRPTKSPLVTSSWPSFSVTTPLQLRPSEKRAQSATSSPEDRRARADPCQREVRSSKPRARKASGGTKRMRLLISRMASSKGSVAGAARWPAAHACSASRRRP